MYPSPVQMAGLTGSSKMPSGGGLAVINPLQEKTLSPKKVQPVAKAVSDAENARGPTRVTVASLGENIAAVDTKDTITTKEVTNTAVESANDNDHVVLPDVTSESDAVVIVPKKPMSRLYIIGALSAHRSASSVNKVAWPPTKPEMPAANYINTGDVVILSHVATVETIFVRHANQVLFKQVVTAGNEYAKQAKSLTALPKRHDLVMALFRECFYRSVVIKAENENQITVEFLDFGNQEIVPLKDIKRISNEMAAHKRSASKITLKPLPDQLKNTEVMAFLKQLLLDETKVRIDFDANTAFEYVCCDIVLPSGRNHYDEITFTKQLVNQQAAAKVVTNSDPEKIFSAVRAQHMLIVKFLPFILN